MRLWIDECLSPTLVEITQDRYETTSNRDRGRLGAKDPELYAQVAAEEFVFVTNNESDFVSLTGYTEVHPGLVIIPTGTLQQQREWYSVVVAEIELRAQADRLTAAAWMVNRMVAYDPETDTLTMADWPPTRP